MALTAQLGLSQIILKDTWPGAINHNLSIPTDGWDNTLDNFTSTAARPTPDIPVGQKRIGYTDNSFCPGTYTMMYLQFHDSSSADISADFSNGNFWCSHYDGSKANSYISEFSTVPSTTVTRCYSVGGGDHGSDVTFGSPLAVPCATIAADSSVEFVTGDAFETGYGDAFGWFWVGGVCPCKDATLLQGTRGSLNGADISVDSLMRKGNFHAEYSSNTLGLFTDDVSNYLDATALTGLTYNQGWACTSAV